MNNNLLSIGVNKETVTTARDSILKILDNKNVGEHTKIEALKAMVSICDVTGTTIKDCTFKAT